MLVDTFYLVFKDEAETIKVKQYEENSELY